MSQENVEILRRSNAAFNRHDRDAAFADYHLEISGICRTRQNACVAGRRFGRTGCAS
jgi:hypothetical protein